MIMVDPTLVMTLRGQAWVQRVHNSAGLGLVSCASSYITFAQRPECVDLDIYRHWPVRRWGEGRYDQLASDVADVMLPVHGHAELASFLRLDCFNYRDAMVVLDIWSGLAAGHWLVARRSLTFDALVQAGVTVTTRGARHFQRTFAEATAELPLHLTEALNRRIRFVAAAVTTPDRGDDDVLALHVSDCGRDSYR